MRSFWAPPEGTGRFSRRAVSAALAVLLDIGCVVLLALHEKHSRRSREIQSDRLPALRPAGALHALTRGAAFRCRETGRQSAGLALQARSAGVIAA